MMVQTETYVRGVQMAAFISPSQADKLFCPPHPDVLLHHCKLLHETDVTEASASLVFFLTSPSTSEERMFSM